MTKMDRVSIVLLAAGSSSRMGTAKQLLWYRGRTLLRRAAEAALASPCRPVIVVLGYDAPRMRGELGGLPLRIVENLDWAAGIGASIRAGVAAALAQADVPAAVVLALCDQPLVGAELLTDLVRMHSATGKGIIAARYGGTAGVPALFGRDYFARLQALPDHAGAKALIAANPHDAAFIEAPAAAIDVDTPEDWEEIKNAE